MAEPLAWWFEALGRAADLVPGAHLGCRFTAYVSRETMLRLRVEAREAPGVHQYTVEGERFAGVEVHVAEQGSAEVVGVSAGQRWAVVLLFPPAPVVLEQDPEPLLEEGARQERADVVAYLRDLARRQAAPFGHHANAADRIEAGDHAGAAGE